MEHPLFKDYMAEFDIYLSELGKPVEKRTTFYTSGPEIEYLLLSLTEQIHRRFILRIGKGLPWSSVLSRRNVRNPILS